MAKTTSKKKTKKMSAARPALKSTASLSTAMKATAQKSTSSSMSVMQLAASFAAMFFVNSLVIFFAQRLFPANIVLGTHMMTPFAGLVYSNVVLAAILVGAVPVIEAVAEQTQTKLSTAHWMGLYFLINVVAIWFVARFAEQLGMGISSWLVAVLLAVVLDFVQGMAIQMVTDKVK